MRKTEQNNNQEGSPTTQPCANSEMSGTAKKQSAAGNINTTDNAGKSIKAGPVPLYLVPQTISSEIHTHGGEISAITVRRTGQHVYAITLTKAAKKTQKRNQKQDPKQNPKQNPKQDKKQGTVQEPVRGTRQTKTTSPQPGRNAGDAGAEGNARDAGEPHAA
ncbi:hypothetical protein [Methanogenium organophilum]|uniref:Uncharacterized protein n=1 Tax=Methanogenium organophilum TaxID=2199 RepID=A0A9X9S5G1_METOG|nr:hypothetical protein [Methanogenium organophilum]WAI01798.1 hypothetical protein OU421_02680 [Methanogenium organophilum]